MNSLDQLYFALISIISSQVGDRLKKVPIDAQGTLGPAIFKGRQKQYKEYPYITVDIVSVREEGGWFQDVNVNDTGLTEYTFNYQALISLSCFGKTSKDILKSFKQSLSFEGVRLRLYENSGNTATLNRSSEVRQSPDFLETEYEEMATMEMTINFKNVVVDPTSGIIESVALESNLLKEDSSLITNTSIVP